MHFVCVPFGSSGDVHPMIGLALALRARGHRVTTACSGYFEPLVRSQSLDYIEMGTREQFLELAGREEVWNPRKALQFLYIEGVAKIMRRHYELLAELRSEGPLVSVSNLFGFGARVAQEKLGIDLVTVHLQPSVMWSATEPPRIPGLFGPRWLQSCMWEIGVRCFVDPAICPSLNAWRAELGLSPVRRITQWWNSPTCVACLFPDWFGAPQPDWPRPLLQTSFPLWDERTDEPLPQEVAEFLEAGPPPVAVTPGSANLFGRSFLQHAVEACQRMGRRAILLTRFASQLPDRLPDSVIHAPYVPFSQLLPRCAVLIHHGGIGSMSQAMAAGIPQVIVAVAHDQFDNGRRVERLGVGRTLAHRRLSTRKLINALEKLDTPTLPAMIARCRTLAERLEGTNGTADMAAAIERHFEGNENRSAISAPAALDASLPRKC
jgi:UDP:flavonoid glycosyltransferase YjiC (YdhE family)